MTIKQKLMALMLASTLLIVGSLTWFFTSNQIAESERNLHGKATTYSQLAGKQVMSAIAFSDRETAREVLSAIATDSDVASIALIGADGDVLFLSGDSTWPGLQSARPRSSRLVSSTPVVSLEGPSGTLVIELSTQRLENVRARLLWIAVATGGVALAAAALFAWLIAGGIARRLRAIARVATAVASGNLDQPPIADARRDEVGVLASAFNTMVVQLKQLVDRIRDMARAEQERLETLVAERTAALEMRNAEMKLVFDQVDQGLLVIGLDGIIASDHSAAVESWLGAIPPSRSVFELVRGFAPERAAWFETAWAGFADDIMPLELAVTQLPSEFRVGSRHLTWELKPFEANGKVQLLAVISDVTAERAREREERDDRELVSMLTRALRDRSGFDELHREISRLVESIETTEQPSPTFARDVHTLKGVAGLVQLGSLATVCHDLEASLMDPEDDSRPAMQAAIAARWRELADRTAPFLAGSNSLDVREDDVAQLEAALARGASASDLSRMMASWREERASARLERFAEQARTLAERLGKGPIDVAIECAPDFRLPATLGPLWTTVAHAIRNAVDHGIESAAERASTTKPVRPTITLRAASDATTMTFDLRDDGRGIQWSQVAEVAASRGLPHGTRAELEAALFSDGVSTRSDVTEISGRGIGMSALLAAATAVGATLNLETTRGEGTTLQVVCPRHPFVSLAARAS